MLDLKPGYSANFKASQHSALNIFAMLCAVNSSVN